MKWGTAGSGILFVCLEDQTALLLKRSPYVEEPGTWGIPGGAIQGTDGWYRDDEVTEDQDTLTRSYQSALIEAKEELGSLPEWEEDLGKTEYRDGQFVYTTYVLGMSKEEKDQWSPRITLNWENDEAEWFPLNRLPGNLHYGVEYLVGKHSVFNTMQRISKIIEAVNAPDVRIVAEAIVKKMLRPVERAAKEAISKITGPDNPNDLWDTFYNSYYYDFRFTQEVFFIKDLLKELRVKFNLQNPKATKLFKEVYVNTTTGGSALGSFYPQSWVLSINIVESLNQMAPKTPISSSEDLYKIIKRVEFDLFTTIFHELIHAASDSYLRAAKPKIDLSPSELRGLSNEEANTKYFNDPQEIYAFSAELAESLWDEDSTRAFERLKVGDVPSFYMTFYEYLTPENKRLSQQITYSQLVRLSEQSLPKISMNTRTAARGIYYHGTTSKNLKTILSQGLQPGKPPNYTDDTHSRGMSLSIETFGGVYVTSNWMTANSHAGNARRKNGGNDLIVALTLEARSPNALWDEDQINPAIEQGSRVRTVQELTDWVTPWGPEANPLKGWNTIVNPESWDQLVESILNANYEQAAQEALVRLRWNIHEKNERQLEYKRVEILGALESALKTYGLYMAGKAFDYDKGRLTNPYSAKDFEEGGSKYYLRDKIEQMQKPSILEGAFAKYKEAIDSLARVLRFANDPEENSFAHNLRFMDPIGFSGKNRILAIGEMVEEKDELYGKGYYTTIIFHHGAGTEAAAEWITQFKKGVGGSYRIIDPAGNLLEYHLSNDYDAWIERNRGVDPELQSPRDRFIKPWPTHLWGPDPRVRVSGVNDNFLYHATTWANAVRILESNSLKPSPSGHCISFTRDPHFADWYISTDIDKEQGAVILVLDKARLTHNYKVEPFDYFSHERNRSDYGWDEYEERVCNREIRDLDRYLVRIYATKYSVNEMFHLQQDDLEIWEYLISHPKFDKDQTEIIGMNLGIGAYSRKHAVRIARIVRGRSAPLYHATSLGPASSIISENILRGYKSSGIEEYGVSLTRDRRFAEGWADVVFVLDQGKVAFNHKINPYDFYKLSPAPGESPRSDKRRKESEEFIPGDLDNVNRYIDLIYLSPSMLKDVIDNIDSWESNDLIRLYAVMSHPKFSKEQLNQIPFSLEYNGQYISVV